MVRRIAVVLIVLLSVDGLVVISFLVPSVNRQRMVDMVHAIKRKRSVSSAFGFDAHRAAVHAFLMKLYR
jgi:hypothetical protein